MNKRQRDKLKRRIMDICNGAGMPWVEGLEYFNFQDGVLERTGRAILAIERMMPEDYYVNHQHIRDPYSLKDFEHIDTLVSLVEMTIEGLK